MDSAPTLSAHMRGAPWQLTDDVIQVREWGGTRTYPLPDAPSGRWLIGTSSQCEIRIVDEQRQVSRRHACIARDHGTLTVSDLASKNGLWVDDARINSCTLVPGGEVGLGPLRLIAESARLLALRAYLAQVIGWAPCAGIHVDLALRCIRATAMQKGPLLLHGDGDLVPIAAEIHRLAFGAAPFIVNDPHDLRLAQGDRWTRIQDVDAAIGAAAGGTLCISNDRTAAARAQLVSKLAQTPDVRLLVWGSKPEQLGEPFRCIALPSLHRREPELDRLIDAYAAAAIASLGASPSSYNAEVRAEVRRRGPTSLTAMERTVTRLIAMLEFKSVTRAASQLGITHAALSRWLKRG